MSDSNKPRLRVHKHSVTAYSAGMKIKAVQLLDGFLESGNTDIWDEFGIRLAVEGADSSAGHFRKVVPDEYLGEFERAAKPLERLTRKLSARLRGVSKTIDDVSRTLVSDACVAVDDLEITIRDLLKRDGFAADALLWFELGLEVLRISIWLDGMNDPPEAFGLPALSKSLWAGKEATWCWSERVKVRALLTELRLEANDLFRDPTSLEALELPIPYDRSSDDLFLVHLWGCLTGGWRYLEKHATHEPASSKLVQSQSNGAKTESDSAEVINHVEIDYGDNCYVLRASGDQSPSIPGRYSKLFGCFVEKVLSGSPSEPVDWLKLNDAVKPAKDDPVIEVANKACDGLRTAKSRLVKILGSLGKTPDGKVWIGSSKHTGYFLNTSVIWTLSKKLVPRSVKDATTERAGTIEETTADPGSQLPSRPITRKPRRSPDDD